MLASGTEEQQQAAELALAGVVLPAVLQPQQQEHASTALPTLAAWFRRELAASGDLRRQQGVLACLLPQLAPQFRCSTAAWWPQDAPARMKAGTMSAQLSSRAGSCLGSCCRPVLWQACSTAQAAGCAAGVTLNSCKSALWTTWQ